MSISKVGTYAFYSHPNLERAVVSALAIEANAFQGAKKLEVVDLTSEVAETIGSNAFNGCSNLTHLVVRSTSTRMLQNKNALTNTNIARDGEGGIYVPSSLLSNYKSSTNWSVYANNIYPLDDYPKANFDSISDSWSTILSNASYATAYAVKDTKTLELTDGTKIKMDLAALNTDVKSDNSGNAKMTWICHGVPYMHRMNATNATDGGWANSDMRSWLISDILSKIPTDIKSHIVSVKKSYRSKSPNDETLWSDDEIWIPSYKEIGFTDASYVESEGIVYSNIFSSNNERVKYSISSTATRYWLRSAASAVYFSDINSNGKNSTNSSTVIQGVLFGFCTD